MQCLANDQMRVFVCVERALQAESVFSKMFLPVCSWKKRMCLLLIYTGQDSTKSEFLGGCWTKVRLWMAEEGQKLWLLTLTGFSSNADGCSEDAKGRDRGDGSRLGTAQRHITHVSVDVRAVLLGFVVDGFLFVCLFMGLI